MADIDHAAEIKTLTTALKERQEAFSEVANFGISFEEGTEGKGMVIAPETVTKARDLADEMSTLQLAIAGHEKALGVDRFLNGDPGTLTAATFGGGSPAAPQGEEYKTIGERVTESEAWAAFKDGGFRTKNVAVELDNTSLYIERKRLIRELERKDIYTAVGGQQTTWSFGRTQDEGIIDRARRKVRVRDLLQAGTTTANLIEYIRVTGFTNGAKPVAEREDGSGNPVTGVGGVNFMLKPESDLAFTPASVPVRTLAHTIRAHRTVLDDEPRLQSLINTEMLYGLQLAEDAQLLTGDGSNAGITGLLNTPGIQLYEQRHTGAAGSEVVTERKSEALRRSLTLVLLAYYEATGFVVSPLDWEDIELEKDANGRPILVTNIAIGAEKQVWRTPVTDTPALAQGHFVTGAFGIGARVWDRQQAVVDVSTEDRDNFVRNAVTIRAEERLALEVPRPEAFVHGQFYGNLYEV